MCIITCDVYFKVRSNVIKWPSIVWCLFQGRIIRDKWPSIEWSYVINGQYKIIVEPRVIYHNSYHMQNNLDVYLNIGF